MLIARSHRVDDVTEIFLPCLRLSRSKRFCLHSGESSFSYGTIASDFRPKVLGSDPRTPRQVKPKRKMCKNAQMFNEASSPFAQDSDNAVQQHLLCRLCSSATVTSSSTRWLREGWFHNRKRKQCSGSRSTTKVGNYRRCVGN